MKSELIMKQQAAIGFSVCLGRSSTETNDLIQQTYSMEVMTWSKIFKWCKEFYNGRTMLELAKDSGYPWTVRTKIMLNMLATLIHADCLLTVQQLTRMMDVSVESVHFMLTEDLKMQHVCTMWMLHHLTCEQLQKQIDVCHTSKRSLQNLILDNFRLKHFSI